MAAPKTDYQHLSTVEQVRVNAVIMDALKNDPKGFGKDFLAYAGKSEEGFQKALDGVRNVLAADIAHVPHTKANGVDDANDLGAQRNVLRQIKEVVGKGATPQKVAEDLAAHTKFDFSSDYKGGNKSYDMATPEKPYDMAQVVAKAAALDAAKGISKAMATDGAALPPALAASREAKGR